MSIARWGRRVSIGVNHPPKWRGQIEAERATMHRAQVDRSPKGQDREAGLIEDESPVPPQGGMRPNSLITSTPEPTQ